jgi:formyltetrahydrofolate deformylase
VGDGSSEDEPTPRYTARLLIDCPDRPGIVAAVSGFLFGQGANIVSSHQYSSDPAGGRFFLRTEFFLESLVGARGEAPVGGLPGAGQAGLRGAGQAGLRGARGKALPGTGAQAPRAAREQLRERFQAQVADRFQMDWRLHLWGERPRMAILVSRQDHCLMDLLWRWRRGELSAQLVAVISNHPDLRGEAQAAGVPYHHIPVPPAGKAEAEAAMLGLLAGHADLVVLARYMQILSGDFLARLGAPVINIHHSFLPAFPGADPYRRAREHGVKLIGATAHYVTEELDAGPIIEQGVERVDHELGVAALERVGRDIERVVLARAVALHLDDRVIVDGARTVVF